MNIQLQKFALDSIQPKQVVTQYSWNDKLNKNTQYTAD